MKLSPLDIKKQEFSRAFRGYSVEEVQAFLDTLARQVEEMSEVNRLLFSLMKPKRGRRLFRKKLVRRLNVPALRRPVYSPSGRR